MTTHETAVRPETANEGICPRCGDAVWWVVTTAGAALSLNLLPDPELGTVEMIPLNGVYQATVLAQRESLFEVEDRLQWRSHTETCTRAGGMPTPRRR